jgi:hypothetical protein
VRSTRGAILRFARTLESQWQALRHHSLAFSWASAERIPPLHEFTVNLTRMAIGGGLLGMDVNPFTLTP